MNGQEISEELGRRRGATAPQHRPGDPGGIGGGEQEVEREDCEQQAKPQGVAYVEETEGT